MSQRKWLLWIESSVSMLQSETKRTNLRHALSILVLSEHYQYGTINHVVAESLPPAGSIANRCTYKNLARCTYPRFSRLWWYITFTSMLFTLCRLIMYYGGAATVFDAGNLNTSYYSCSSLAEKQNPVNPVVRSGEHCPQPNENTLHAHCPACNEHT